MSILKLTAEKPSHTLTPLDFKRMESETLLLDTSSLIQTGSLVVCDDTAQNCHELSTRIWPNIRADSKPKLLFMNITHSNGPFGVFLKSTSHTNEYIKFRNSFDEAPDSECLIVNSYAFREHGSRIVILVEPKIVNWQIRSVMFTVVSYPYFNNEPYDDDTKLETLKSPPTVTAAASTDSGSTSPTSVNPKDVIHTLIAEDSDG